MCRPLLVVLLAASTAFAQDPREAQPERPSVATHAGTVAPGFLEIEAGAEGDRNSDRSRGGSIPTTFKIGVAPRLQLTVQMPFVHPAGEGTGLGDVAFGLKWRVVEKASVLGDFAILPIFKVPSGSSKSGAGTGTTDVQLLLISSHEFGPVDMDVNVGYTRRSGDGTSAPRSSEVWTTSFGGPFHGKWGWAAEVFGYPGTSGPAGAPPIAAVLGGPTFSVRKNLALDAGFIAPLTGPQPRAVYAGLVYNVGRLR